MERLSTGKSYCSSFASLNSDGLLSTIDAQVNDKALEFDQDDTMDSEIPDKLGVASFDGSFAPLTRPIVVGVPIPWYRDKKYFTDGWTSLSIWKSAFIEAVATMCLVYVSGQISATLSTYDTPKAGAVAGVANVILLSIFIYAASPASGGHLNPMITFSAMCSGLCPIARGVLYLIAQLIGSALAGGILIGVWGFERASKYRGGGCFLDTDSLTHGQVFLNEVIACFALLYLAYGLGLDPRQAIFFGPRLGPLLVGTSLGLISFATSSIVPGYQGAQMNPARCFAYAVARRDFSAQWIWWFGPAIASILLALVYNTVPPHHSAGSKRKPDESTTEHITTV